ncbi:glycosyltransferase family 2 protein [Stieleria varia]|uniref:Glycosyl transferase family 2 n=1 Tax=Stieleria varia TaxID=2528005 RepID=A0A5C6B3T9_9BACT|nr:glycosyltransferase [Stieleria varia]TWU05946.1 Glycosyl transferase family 2 [Stieleria varia]
MITIAIPTYGRDAVLIDSVSALLSLEIRADEILVIDQTPEHDLETQRKLQDWHDLGDIRWIRLETPSITRSMNHALQHAMSELVLFLDDDILPRAEIVAIHSAAHVDDPSLWATVGQVIQPWQKPEDVEAPRKTIGLRIDEDFPFHSTRDMDVQNVMAGNLCVHRQRALSIGGFDENFVGSAYRFETEFARRIGKAGGKIRFLGGAGIDHLRAERGGTRSSGSHLTSADPKHGVGDHYFALLHADSPTEARAYCMKRILREVRTKFHLTHPWWIPVKLVGEIRAYFAAKQLVEKKRVSS